MRMTVCVPVPSDSNMGEQETRQAGESVRVSENESEQKERQKGGCVSGDDRLLCDLQCMKKEARACIQICL